MNRQVFLACNVRYNAEPSEVGKNYKNMYSIMVYIADNDNMEKRERSFYLSAVVVCVVTFSCLFHSFNQYFNTPSMYVKPFNKHS